MSVAGALIVGIDSTASEPLYEQIYRGIRDLIRSGQLLPGTRIPSSRILATDLSVSRSTVLLALEQLAAEGYLTSRARSGTRIAHQLPDLLLSAGRVASPRSASLAPASRAIGSAGERIATFNNGFVRLGAAPRPFRPGTPALDQFPTELWSRLAVRRYRRMSFSLMDQASPRGYGPLREAIATHVQSSRGVSCTPEQVIVTSGAQQALALAADVLLAPGDQVWMEDPGYLNMRGIFARAGACIVGVPIDSAGLNVKAAISAAPCARLAYVTPSFQFPLGVTMSIPRRHELLDWAAGASSWILEDDYDSECRFSGHPLPALQGLDINARVIYVGTFSKTVFPSLRLGYVIAPPDLVETFTSARVLADGHPSSMDQAILADFMTEGHFTRHVRRMRAVYADRQARLVAAVHRELDGIVSVSASPAGLHLLAWLPTGVSDMEVSRSLAARGIEAPALSSYYTGGAPDPSALILGYGALDEKALCDGIRALREVLGSLCSVGTRPRLPAAQARIPSPAALRPPHAMSA